MSSIGVPFVCAGETDEHMEELQRVKQMACSVFGVTMEVSRTESQLQWTPSSLDSLK